MPCFGVASPAPMTAAPAPSPKSTATSRPRSVNSTPVECTSAPTRRMFSVDARAHPRVGDREAVEEAGALVSHVERRARRAGRACGRGSTRSRGSCGRARASRRRSRRRPSRSSPACSSAILRRGHGEIARADAVVLDEAALLDARALDDPLVRGGHQLGEVVVGDDLGRDVVADARGSWSECVMRVLL